MDTAKPWYQSTTIWGSIVTLFCGTASVFHLHPDAKWASDAVDFLTAAGTLFGAGVTLVGRLKATRTIAPISGPAGGSAKAPLWLLAAATAAALACGGCSVFTRPAGGYVAADAATYDAVAPEYQAYVENDPSLSPDQKARRQRTLQTWQLRIEQATAAAATQPATGRGPAPVPATAP